MPRNFLAVQTDMEFERLNLVHVLVSDVCLIVGFAFFLIIRWEPWRWAQAASSYFPVTEAAASILSILDGPNGLSLPWFSRL